MMSGILQYKKIRKELRYVQKNVQKFFLRIHKGSYKWLQASIVKPCVTFYKRLIKKVSKRLSSSTLKFPKYFPRSLGLIFSLFFVFIVIYQVSAVTPNPGHPWSDVGDGLVVFSTPSAQRTYTLPDATTNIITATTGAVGFVSRWISPVLLGTSTLIDNGAVLGVNASSSGVTFNLQGNAGSGSPFVVASSTGASLFTILANGNIGVGSSTPGSKLVVAGTLTTQNLIATSTTATSTFAGSVQIGAATNKNNFFSVRGNYDTSGYLMTIQNNNTAGYSDLAFLDNNGTEVATVGYGGSTLGGIFANRAFFSGNNKDIVFSSNGTVGQIFISSTTGNIGIGTSTSGYSLTIAPLAGVNPFMVASSSGPSLLTLGANGRLGLGSSTPFAMFSVTANPGTSLLSLASSSGANYLTLGVNGNLGLGSSTPSATLSITGASGVKPFFIASSTGTTMLDLGVNGRFTMISASTTNLTIGGLLHDNIGSGGTLGMVLQSTATSTRWAATSTLGLMATTSTVVTRPSLATGAITAKVVSSLTVANIAMFNVPAQIIVNQISFRVSAVTTAGTMKVCVYNEAGNRIIDVTTGTITAAVISTAVSAVTLPPGNYYIAQLCATTCNDTVSYFTTTSVPGFNAATVPAGKKVLEGTGTMTSGTCNATLPAITPAVSSGVIGRLDQ